MNNLELKNPAYLFEVSWEVCNKVGGIHTVISTKVLSMAGEFKNNHILIGPDVWRYDVPNPEFTEDPHLFKSWRLKAAQEGLRIKVGRWNIAGNPAVILVDFTSFIPQKDQILTSFWDKFQVDSLTGQWDYIEPVLFGFTAGKVIESFVRYHVSARQQVIAQFHEWMTGSGLLYLRDVMPQIGCVFTTHATVLGRSIAGNGLPLYDPMKDYDPAETARRFGVTAKQSLESKSAEWADAFTTVSDITALECAHFLGKNVDTVTPNGFENSFTPDEANYPRKRQEGRDRLLKVAQAQLGRAVAEDALIVGISGRYEFKNKGLDVFVEALGRLNRNAENKRDILAFILVPAGFKGVNRELVNNLERPYQAVETVLPYMTHELSDPQNDPVLRKLGEEQLLNRAEDKVKVFFCPSYLNGNDGVFNMPYYDLLVGMDLTVFPSYYEPWGYTPLESLAFKVPTITTTLAGFGLWVESHYKKAHPGIEVIRRDDRNNEEVVRKIADKIKEVAAMNKRDFQAICKNAKEVSKIALWENLVSYYNDAYRMAVGKVNERIAELPVVEEEQWSFIEKKSASATPNWISVIIHRSIPERLRALEELTNNLWWCWNEEAIDLFKSIDSLQWMLTRHNPIALLDKISLNRYKELENDEEFVARLEAVYNKFSKYMEEKKQMSEPSIAYFSMEYGLHSSLKIYSGGLGVLAGDYMKEASDKKTKITGVGLLYRYGYFTQKFSAAGNQEAEYEAQDFTKIPVVPARDDNGNWLTISLTFPGRDVYARIWKVNVGRVELYLLDTDYEDNQEADRSITHFLYGGDWENRLKQEILLGIGGIRALRKLGIEADVYHCNEGHAAFTGLERLREYVADGQLSFAEAMEVVRASSLFTTHTPVPAGHDSFSEGMLKTYFWFVPDRLKITWEQMLALGRVNANDPNEKFSMSFLAANLSQEVNGVSWLHGKVSRDIFKDLWPGYMPEELHISYVTNGVHYPTWAAPEWKKIQGGVFGEKFKTHHYDKACFEGIYQVPDSIISETRNILRSRLIRHIKHRLADEQVTAYFTPKQIVDIQDTLRDDILTIGFARRFATYKRAHLLFRNLDRLNEIVNNPDRPVQFIFAGKAHPADQAGQDLIKRIVEVSKYPQFLGKILFLPNYDMDLARLMVQGVDVWMNTPTRPQEASGTSGEKAAMNGVMHFSVLDGWWVEGYQKDAGWALPMERAYENQEFQNELDSEMIYNIIESEIAPAFYDKAADGISASWAGFIKNTIAKVAANFTSNRMLSDYEDKFYLPMSRRYHRLSENNYALANQIAEWKKKVSREWDSVQVDGLILPDKSKQIISLGKSYQAKVTLELGELSLDDVGIELVAMMKKDERLEVCFTQEFVPVSFENGKGLYSIEVTPDDPGQFMLGLRIFPKNILLPHRQDFALVKWV
ncbi:MULTISPECIES: alpha-glucan family phosphorylase [Butyricimonas]|uniref:alpha-glucan family phosphorylase n=1 Tax=Butyricimonas TaxID=574697 RepID=UPI001D07833B|nr:MULTISPECIES: alpha-glucan family phosphorylase [Butyricimonas]MCB6971437.1 alpha-glucan family phosphorylase [Butyricimonas synergistica]MCG4518151.1 alpha-glucan family phosphorylase [Butyricimonas sp. DFI.6.44]